MTHRILSALVAGLASLFIAAAAPAALPAEISGQPLPSLAPLVKTTSPAVVNIATRGTVDAPNNPLLNDPFFRRFFNVPPQQQQREVSSAGSGVIFDAGKGYIVTNHHVIENADEIEIGLDDGRSLEAKIIGSDPGTDIAVIQVKDPENLTSMALGDSDAVEVGDFVLAIGNPFGLEHTVTSGIVSALGRQGINRDGYEDFIQTDASINPGNSGGALVNLAGELIGVNSAIFSNSGGNIGIGFAIPVNIAKSIMAQLIEFGEVKRGLLGVQITDFNAEAAEAFGLDDNVEGALVQQVVPNSAAEAAGIEVGDVIVKVDGETISGANELRTAIGLRRTGEKVRVDLIRAGKSRTVTATLAEDARPAEMAATDIHPGLDGAELADYTDDIRGLGNGGVIVQSLEPGSRAELAGLQTEDIIVALNNVRLRDLGELKRMAADKRLFYLSIRRNGRPLLVRIR